MSLRYCSCTGKKGAHYCRQAGRQTDGQIGKQTCVHKDKHTDRQTGKQADKCRPPRKLFGYAFMCTMRGIAIGIWEYYLDSKKKPPMAVFGVNLGQARVAVNKIIERAFPPLFVGKATLVVIGIASTETKLAISPESLPNVAI